MITPKEFIIQEKPFASLDLTQIPELHPETEILSLSKDELLFKEGDAGNSFFVVLEGEVNVFVDADEQIQARIGAGECVGEMALLTGQPRIATVRARANSRLLQVSYEGLTHLIENYPHISEYFEAVTTKRLYDTYLLRALQNNFPALDGDALSEIAQSVEWRQLKRGEVLFREGDEGDALYMVIMGRLRVTITENQQARILGEVPHSALVGELAILTNSPRSATVYAVRDTILVSLDQAHFHHLVEQNPQIMVQMTRLIVERQQENLNQREAAYQPSLNVVFVPLSDNLHLPEIINQAESVVEKWGSLKVLDRASFITGYGYESASEIRLEDSLNILVASWLTEREIQYDYLFLATDLDWTNWTERCIQRADRVVFVADAMQSPEQRAIEKKVEERYPQVRKELLLIHPSETEHPTGTVRWLEQRNLSIHHHLRRGDVSHLRRFFRRVIGHPYSVVLSGGGARGYTHIGVLKALEEADFEVDMIGGTSMGALIGAGYAHYQTSEKLHAFAEALGSAKKIFDYTLPLVSLMQSQKVNAIYERLFGEIQIEDLWIPFFCVSSNVSQAEPFVHDRGSLRRAVRASSAIPAVFSPILWDGNLLLDGGVMNNFPVNIMRERAEQGTVVGSLVKSRGGKRPYEIDDHVSGWSILWRRINPFAKRQRVPSLVSTILRGLDLNSTYNIRSLTGQTDLLIQHDLSFSILEFDQYDPIIASGYEAAKLLIQEWQHV